MVKPRWNLLVLVLLHLLLVLSADGKKKYTIPGPIKTVVVVVMENRSFDHMLGWLKRLNPEVDGLTGQESNPFDPTDPNSERLYVNDKAEFVDFDPGHSYQAILQQVFSSNDTQQDPAPMNGFVVNADGMGYGDEFKRSVMGGFRPEVVPVFTRMYVHSATSHGAYSNVREDLVKGFPQKTIMDSVADAGLSWGVYYQNIPTTLVFRNLRKLKNVPKFHEYSLKFKLHAMLGMLPNYVVLEQRYFDLSLLPANDDHPSHDVAEGQKFVKEVYEILRKSPQWKGMLLLVTYDEHGGFYDHVPTPIKVPSPDGIVGKEPWTFKFDRLGVRVPTIAISPWINKGTVVHRPTGPRPDSQYEHSSIAATVKKIFGLDDFLTKRDEWAGTFEHIFSERTTPREDCPEELPNPPWSLRHVPADESRPLTEFQEELVELASQLNGDHVLKDYPHIGKKLNVRQGHEYVTQAVRRFFREGEKALRSGMNESSILELQTLKTATEDTSLIGRRTGSFNELLQST